MEILFEGREGRALPGGLAQRATQTGGRYRIEVPEADLYGVLGQLKDCDARILSVSPVRPTLEDYFFRLVKSEAASGLRRGGGCPMSAMSAMPAVVAVNTFREAVRDRVLYNLIFFAFLMIGRRDSGGSDFDRNRTAGHHQSGTLGDFRVRPGDGHLHRGGTRLRRRSRSARSIACSRSRFAAGNSSPENSAGFC